MLLKCIFNVTVFGRYVCVCVRVYACTRDSMGALDKEILLFNKGRWIRVEEPYLIYNKIIFLWIII